VPPETLVRTLTGVVSRLRAELVIMLETPLRLRGQIGGLQLEAAVEPDPPHRLTGLRLFPLGERVTDPRVAGPSTRMSGEVPAVAAAVAAESFTELGLPGLVLAGAPGGATPGDRSGWVAARGWASLEGAILERASLEGSSLEGPVPLTPDHRAAGDRRAGRQRRWWTSCSPYTGVGMPACRALSCNARYSE
jgi:hypothetical protein